MPSTIGSKTRSAITYGPESHKLFLEFIPVGTIEQGTPVILDAAAPGTVKPAAAGELLTNIIGYAITGGNETAYGEFVTIACRGFMVVNCIASVAVTPGPVEFVSVDGDGLVVVKISTDPTKTIGWAIAGAADTESVEVLMQ